MGSYPTRHQPSILGYWFASPLRASLQCNLKLVSLHGAKERPKKDTDYSRLVGGRFNKPRNLLTRLALVGHKMDKYLYLHTKSFKFV